MKREYPFAVWLKEWISDPDIALPHLQSDWDDTNNPFTSLGGIEFVTRTNWSFRWCSAYMRTVVLRRILSRRTPLSEPTFGKTSEVLGSPEKSAVTESICGPEGEGVEYIVQAMVLR